MPSHKIVAHDQWTEARKALLAEEKEFTRQRDALSRKRRELPWEPVTKTYIFDGPQGRESLTQLFAGKSQLIVYHFMFDPAWEAGCKSCSFWADNYDRHVVHLAARDTTLIAVSRAPLAKLEAFKRRMGWSFKWVSSGGNDFNHDFQVWSSPEEKAKGVSTYNYAPQDANFDERPGISVFAKDAEGAVFHTYSCYARGLDMLNAGYHLLDLTPKGRDEADQKPHAMAWVRLRDSYG